MFLFSWIAGQENNWKVAKVSKTLVLDYRNKTVKGGKKWKKNQEGGWGLDVLWGRLCYCGVPPGATRSEGDTGLCFLRVEWSLPISSGFTNPGTLIYSLQFTPTPTLEAGLSPKPPLTSPSQEKIKGRFFFPGKISAESVRIIKYGNPEFY